MACPTVVVKAIVICNGRNRSNRYGHISAVPTSIMSAPLIVCSLKNRCPLRKQVNNGSFIQLFGCHVLGCTKSLHMACYQGHVLRKNALQPLISGDNQEKELICCSKRCYDKLKKEQQKSKNSSSRTPWHNDGKNGEDDPNC